jgi:heat shock protein HslJ
MTNSSPGIAVALLLAFSLTACTASEQILERDSVKNTQSLEATSWWVEDIDGKGVIDNSHTTIEFGEDGKVSGDTGCNRYFGSYETTEKEGAAMGITFGPLAGTRRACAPALMNQESDFYRSMASVRQWEIADTGLLYLSDERGARLLRAFRTEE